MAKTLEAAVAVIGIDIGNNSFHVVGLDRRGAIVLRQKWSRGQVVARLPIADFHWAPRERPKSAISGHREYAARVWTVNATCW